MKEQGDLLTLACQCLLNGLDKEKDADENGDADQVRTGRPVWTWTIHRFVHTTWGNRHWLQSVWIATCSCEASRKLPCSANSWRRPRAILIDKALQADLQQNNACNPFSEESKAMIRDMGNVELFELCETIPKVRCSERLLYWNQGVIYCTCGHLLVESESSRHLHQWRLDALSIPNYVIKKGRPRGARHGKNWSTEGAPHSPQCEEEMYQKEFWRNSRSLPTRLNIPWSATQNWLDRGEVHRGGQVGTGKLHLSPILWGVREI